MSSWIEVLRIFGILLQTYEVLFYFLLIIRISKISWRTWWKMPMKSRSRWAEATAPLTLMKMTWKQVSKTLTSQDYDIYSDFNFDARDDYILDEVMVMGIFCWCVHRAGCFGRWVPDGWWQLLPGWGFNSSFHPRGPAWRQVDQQGTKHSFRIFPFLFDSNYLLRANTNH